jgi:hypothetical protein
MVWMVNLALQGLLELPVLLGVLVQRARLVQRGHQEWENKAKTDSLGLQEYLAQ